jgi:NAD(P)-dependent dehydrogenase (short-subunit alcohol dehydrogenase family)
LDSVKHFTNQGASLCISKTLSSSSNRGLGQAFVNVLLQAGAAKIYAAARDPSSITLSGVVPIQLDVTKESDIVAAAARCADLTLLINNAGIYLNSSFLAAGSADAARAELETNFFGPQMLS